MDQLAQFKRVAIDTDVLIIGGGTAGCLAAVEARERFPHLKVTILEKAHVDRSGCLAGGMNAINAYLNADETPDSFTKFVRADSMGIIREDLVKSQAELFEYCVKKVESWGLPVKKEADGKTYMVRGRWNIRINGESLKPIIARGARNSGAQILNWTVVTNLIVQDGRAIGAFGFNVRRQEFVIARAKTVLVCTGGAAGLYRPNNQHDAQHKTWYCPFNTGAGYAMGIRAGAEMTSFEMRYIALRTKDVIAPTGTVALGANAPFINGKGENFMQTRWAHLGGDRAPTPIRAYAPIQEIKEGRGPVYLDTTHLDREGVRKLKEAFLDMYPDQVLYWLANEMDPGVSPVEVQTTEPYIVGGHCQSGYWIDVNRETTIHNLFAAGDVAGGAPYKFVSGCWAEGVIAARAMGKRAGDVTLADVPGAIVEREMRRVYAPLFYRTKQLAQLRPPDFEHRLQKILEEYAGGSSTFFEMNEERLVTARKQLARLPEQFPFIEAHDLHDLMLAHSVMDRVDVAQTLVEHLIARKETRWPGYQTRLDYPERDDAKWSVFINSRRDPATGKLEVLTRPYEQIVPGSRYEG